MLIANASLLDGSRADLRVQGGRITAMAQYLPPNNGEEILPADGGALLPGLNDHHTHLFALAAAQNSCDCAAARNAAELAQLLRAAAQGRATLRAVNYHESIAGDIDAAWLDKAVPHAVLRVQHRSGRLWILNAAALRTVRAHAPAALAADAEAASTGRFFDQDEWLGKCFSAGAPDLAPLGALLAQRGVTGVTDATPANTRQFLTAIAAAQASGALPQTVAAMGTADILRAPPTENLFPVAIKLHLHEGDYPSPEAVMDMARRADAAGLRLAVHCVTVADLVFTLSLLLECGLAHRARIEHASLVPPDMIQALAQSRVTVVTQPHFIAERGDDYRRDIAAQEHDDLYRCATLRQAGVKVAFGTDAPFGHFDPWASMHAAVRRRTPSGAVLGAADSVSPEQALAMYTTPLTDPGGTPRTLAVGQVADLCLLTRPWRVARQDLGSVSIKATFCRGNLVHGAGAQEMGRKVA